MIFRYFAVSALLIAISAGVLFAQSNRALDNSMQCDNNLTATFREATLNYCMVHVQLKVSDHRNRVFGREPDPRNYPAVVNTIRATSDRTAIAGYASLCVNNTADSFIEKITENVLSTAGLTEAEKERLKAMLDEPTNRMPNEIEYCGVAAEEAVMHGVAENALDPTRPPEVSKELFKTTEDGAKANSGKIDDTAGWYVGFVRGLNNPQDDLIDLPGGGQVRVRDIPEVRIDEILDNVFNDNVYAGSLNGYVAGIAQGRDVNEHNGPPP